MHSYLKCRKQRIKIGSHFSRWLEVAFGIPQGSILGPLLFNIFINDLFLVLLETEICNFADDNTIYAYDSNLQNVSSKLEKDLKLINKWFVDNSMVANPEKYQVMFLGVKDLIPININVGGKYITSKDEVELLGITIDNKLNFGKHIKNLCIKANNKICAILRLRKNLSISQTRLIINAHVFTYFHYCPLIWMFCRKMDMKLINKVHKRALRVIYNDFTLELEELLSLEKIVPIHTVHLRKLMLEVYKSLNHKNPKLMWDLFSIKTIPYNLRGQLLVKLPTARSTTYGINSLLFKASIMWNSLPNLIKTSPNISLFKIRIKEWCGESCTCTSCKI